MKNDLDFIRNKIENSGVNAPADMDEAYVMKMLENAWRKPDAEPAHTEKPKRKILRFAIPAVAALLVLTLTLGIFLRIRPADDKKEDAVELIEIAPSQALSLHRFNSYDEVKTEINRLRTANNYAYDGDEEVRYEADDLSSVPINSYASGAASQPSYHNSTYIQVTGVDEADIILTDDRYIYCIENSYRHLSDKVVIFSAEGEDSRRVAEIDVMQGTPSTDVYREVDDYYVSSYYPYYGGISDMYLRDDRLIVIFHYTDPENGSVGMTKAMVYDVADVSDITLLHSFTQSGYYDASRMIGDTLYLVSSYMPVEEELIPCCGEDPEEIPADCIYGLAASNSESFLVISAYDTLDQSTQTESKAILGGVDDIYCNQDHMYVYASYWNRTESDDEAEVYNRGKLDSQILKVDLTDGIAFDAYTAVNGTIDDQYALDEYNGYLRVATTSTSESWVTSNNLYVLDENLSVVGSVTGFAEEESIKAVRYIGDTAYVITYVQTDPLFVIDLSQPTAPAILGEVEITGFSTMLVPVDENTLLGIGIHTETSEEYTMEVQSGLKLALFDVSDKAQPKVLDSLTYAECYSDVQENPKALVINRQRGDYVIPLNYMHWEEYSNSAGIYDYTEEYIGGMLNFKVEDGKLVEIDRYESDVDSVERCAYVGDNIYMTYYDVDHRLQIKSVPYR